MSDRARDVTTFFLLLGGTVVYLYFWPRDFYVFDEGLYLYEAKRVLDGQVMYRDFFNILTPGWFYFMAGLYWIFGVSLETARMGMGVVHGMIGALTYAISRRAGVRPSLALAAALTHMTLGYLGCAIVTPHWFSSFGTLGILWVVMRRPAASGLQTALWGALSAALIFVQHQRGLPIAVAVGLVIALDQLDAHARQPLRGLLVRAGAYVAALLLVLGAALLPFVAIAGAEPFYRALVTYPLVNYRRITAGAGWGLYASFIVPLGFLVMYLPLLFPVAALRALYQWFASKEGRRRGRPLRVTLTFSLFTLLSVVYLPDYTHFAYVAPVWFTVAAQLLEALCAAFERWTGRPRLIGRAVAAVAIVGFAWFLADNLRARRAAWAFPLETAFGRVDLRSPAQVAVHAWLIELLRSAGAREIFAFPASPGLYLMTETTNPTPFQIILPFYTDPDQIDAIVAILETREVPFVIRSFYWRLAELEPLGAYIREHYVPIKLPEKPWSTYILNVYRRKTPPRAAAPYL